MQSAKGSPWFPEFYNHFSQSKGSVRYNNSINCCMYSSYSGNCLSSGWEEETFDREQWDGMEILSSPFKVGMLLDLDEGTLSVYVNGRKLGVMKRGLEGQYCWVASMLGVVGSKVTIRRGTVPAS